MTGEEPLVDPELLERLACPKTHKPLKLAGPEVVAAINDSTKGLSAGNTVNECPLHGLLEMYEQLDVEH